MRLGPCVFVTISRNFASWIEHDCPGPDLNDFTFGPGWDTWTGRSHGVRNNLLSNADAPPLSGLHVKFSKFGFKHVMILLPNPCHHGEATVEIEKKCVAALCKLLFL